MVQLMLCSFDCNKCNIGSRGGSFHQKVLKTICLLGRRNGLQTVDEWRPPSYSGGVQPKADIYTPSIDLVWLLDIVNIIGEPNFNKLHSIIFSWTKGKIPRESLRFIPYASFEVEVSDPTSKTIYSDFHNLVATRSVIKFEVIREIREMNIGRAERIRRSAIKFCGVQDMFILTPEMLDNLVKRQNYKPSFCTISKRKSKKLKPIQKKLLSLATELNLDGIDEFTPPEWSGSKDVYTPRLDAAWLVSVPKSASDMITTLLEECSFKTARDLCHLTLFGFEHEEKTSQKHIAGGVANLSRHSHIGFLITPTEKTETARRIVNKYSIAFGFNNVFVLNEETFTT